jgi:hypothetical protein
MVERGVPNTISAPQLQIGGNSPMLLAIEVRQPTRPSCRASPSTALDIDRRLDLVARRATRADTYWRRIQRHAQMTMPAR